MGIQLGGPFVDQLGFVSNTLINNGGAAIRDAFGGSQGFDGVDLDWQSNTIGGNGNVFPGYYDALGRYWFVRASVSM